MANETLEPPGKSDTSDISLSLLAKLCKQIGKSNDLRSFVILARCILIALDTKVRSNKKPF